MSKIKNYLIPIILGFLTACLTILPVLVDDLSGVFFNFEPDIVYVANAISYTQTHQIKYNGHPATPTIWLISQSFLPLRFYAKFIAHVPFVRWTILNQSFLYLYERILQAIILGLATTLFLSVIKKATRSKLSVLFAWTALFTFRPFLYLGSVIASEATSFLILSVWFWIFSLFIVKQKQSYLALLSFLAGLATANKFTNLFYIVISLGLVITTTSSVKLTFRKISKGGILTSLGFIFGTWPIRHSYPSLFKWVARLATTSSLHGAGNSSLFDFPVYLNSAKTLLFKETWPAIISLIFFLFLFYKLSRRQIKIFSPLTIASISSLLGILIFAKYPLSHYQLPNYILIIFVFCLLLKSVKQQLILIIMVTILFFGVKQNLTVHYDRLSTDISGTINMEKHILQNPSKTATLWEFGSVRDYTLIHSRDWIGGVYSDELHQLRPDLLSLTTDLKYVKTTTNKLLPVFQICWDKLYIQQAVVPNFTKLYPNQPLEISLINNSQPRNMALIKSDHCLR